MKIDAIRSNRQSVGMNVSKNNNKPTFRSVYMSPSRLALNVIRNNINDVALDKIEILWLKYTDTKKWDMLIGGYNGKLNFQAVLKDKMEKLSFYIQSIKPLNNGDIEPCEFQASAQIHSRNREHIIINFKFNNADDANKAYDKLCKNYQTFDKIRMQDSFDSNLEFIRIADENFGIIETAEITKITKV